MPSSETAPVPPPVSGARAPFPGATLFIVDDDRLNIRILEGILQPHGCQIVAAESGEALLDQYPTVRPDLVLLDVVLPGLDGFATCRALRERYGTDAAPVIFITSRAEAEDVVAGFSAGGVDYLPKPFEPKEALARIRTHLHNRQLLEQLSRANAAKNRFLGMAAHDLRNPLASIRGVAQFLQDSSVGPLNPEQAELAGLVESTAQSMLRLVDELLDVATIEAGELRLHRAAAPLGALLDRVIPVANLDAARKQTRIVREAAPQLPPVLMDEAKIRQVIENLLSNAVKFSPPCSLVRVTHHADDRWQHVAVLDQGPGIPEAERSKLFSHFGRLSTQPTGGEKSTGLGLAICRKIIESHGGTIGAENVPGGCRFSFSLPVLR